MAGVKGRSGSGGKREGAGRPKKADEIALIEKLSPFDDIAHQALINGVKAEDYNFVKLYFAYRYGNPSQSIDMSTQGSTVIEVIYANDTDTPTETTQGSATNIIGGEAV